MIALNSGRATHGGPVGQLIGATDISHFRPAHVHFLINAAGYEPLITHLFQEGAR